MNLIGLYSMSHTFIAVIYNYSHIRLLHVDYVIVKAWAEGIWSIYCTEPE